MASEIKDAAAKKISATKSSAKDFKRESAAARFTGAGIQMNLSFNLSNDADCRPGTAGLAELLIFHPVC